MTLNKAQFQYVDVPESLRIVFESVTSYSFTGWIKFQTVSRSLLMLG
jgi:hypothetical protein